MLDMSQDSVRQTSTDATGSADDGLAYILLILNFRGLERRCLQLVRTWIVLQRVRFMQMQKLDMRVYGIDHISLFLVLILAFSNTLA